MKVLTENQCILNNVMEEIEVFKNVESPTGERIKLFLDELEFEPACDEPPLDLPVPRCVSPGVDFDIDDLKDQ